jgi:hypothetical protein
MKPFNAPIFMKKAFFIGISLVLLISFVGLLYTSPSEQTLEDCGPSEQALIESLSTELDAQLSSLFEDKQAGRDSLKQLAAYFSMRP